MSAEVYNSLTIGLLLGSLVALGLAVVYLVAAIVGWKGPHRNHRLVRFAILLLLFPTSIGIQQLLLYQVFMPSLGHAARRERQTFHDTRSVAHVGDQAPSFTLTDTDGREFVLDGLRGKLVLVNFFATWCGPCLMELPHVQQLWDEHRDNSRFALIVIGREETTETVSDFRSKQGYTFPMAPDPKRSAFSLYAEEFIPRMYLIGADGKICFASTGFDEDEFTALKTEIAKQLGSIEYESAQFGQSQ